MTERFKSFLCVIEGICSGIVGAQCNSLVIVDVLDIPNEVERSMRGVHTQLLKVVPKGGWAHSWCPTVVICIFPSKMGAHKPELVEM